MSRKENVTKFVKKKINLRIPQEAFYQNESNRLETAEVGMVDVATTSE